MRRTKKITKNKRESGFSILELIIAMSIFLIGIAAIYGALRMATIQRNVVSTRTDQLRSARIALEYVRRDAVNAGFGYHRTGGNIPDNAGNGLFGITSDADTEQDLLTAIIAANDVSTNTLNFGTRMDGVAFAFRDAAFNVDPAKPGEGGQLIKYAGATTSGSTVTLTTAVAGDAANCRQFDLYLMESSGGTTQVLGMASAVSASTIQFATGAANDPFGINAPANGTGTAQSLLATTTGGGAIKRINLIAYSITSDGVLVRKRYGNQTGKASTAQIETRELVYGVSDFQIKYFMEDGTSVDDPSNNNNGRNNQLNMNSVVQIQMTITLAADATGGQQLSTPITIKEYISTKNLRYESS